MEDFTGQTAYAEYDNFTVDDASTYYKLSSLGQYHGTAGELFIDLPFYDCNK